MKTSPITDFIIPGVTFTEFREFTEFSVSKGKTQIDTYGPHLWMWW